MSLTRLKWRLRGAWQWPAFMVAIVIEGVLLQALPVWGNGPGDLFAGMLLAAAFNLIIVAILAPLASLLLRRRRPDLPRAIASDYCGAMLIAVLLGCLIVGGIVHHSAVSADKRDRVATARAISTYVHHQERDYLGRLGAMTIIKLEPDFYRGCVPASDPGKAMCLFVNTDQSPAGVKRDPETVPNEQYRR
jgi:hypothetical protein